MTHNTSYRSFAALLFFSIVVFSSTILVSHAEETALLSESEIAPLGAVQELQPEGTVNCFDYYAFGSVQAKVVADSETVVSGTNMTFGGVIENNNPYPIVDGALYVKIFKKRNGVNDGNGPDVVDQFLVRGDIVIPANASTPITFEWRVPVFAQSGEYEAAMFFTSSRKFNLLGLSFTDDIVGNVAPFKIIGDQESAVTFKKSAVTVNQKPFFFASLPPRLKKDEPAVITAEITNTTNEKQTASVVWTVSQWDAQLRENAVQEVPQTVEIPARGSKKVTVTVSDSKYPVYYTVGVLRWNDTKSVIGVRFTREDVNRIRINFPSITAYPLREGEQNTLFSCLHNSGSAASVPNGKLDITLSDMKGNELHKFTYKGAVTGTMMGVADSFIPKKDYDSFILDARLYDGETFIDEAHLVYDCNTLNPGECMIEDESSDVSETQGLDIQAMGIGGYGILSAIVGAVLIIFALIWWMIRRNSNGEVTQ